MSNTRKTLMTTSGVVFEGGGDVHAIVDGGHTGNVSAILYDEIAAIASQAILTYRVLANDSKVITFNPPLHCERGLFVTQTTNDRSILFVWEPSE